MKKITIVTPCFNEAENVEELALAIKSVMRGLSQYEYEHLYIDNDSSDNTVEIIRLLAAKDSRVKAILNTRNFGQIRSPYYGLLVPEGDATIIMASDMQDPPELIPEFIKKWEEGYKVVMGVKTASKESPIFYLLRTAYYRLLQSFSEIPLVEHATGFGMYDKDVIHLLRELDEPYPYFRGMIADLGFEKALIPYTQPLRKRGITKNNFYTLYDMAMQGFINHSKLPLRLAAIVGFLTSLISFLVGMLYLVYKLVFWESFSLGQAPVIIGLFFVASIQLFFLGVVGEYIGAIYTHIIKRPLVVEKERINFP